MKSPWILLMGSIVLTILSLAGAGEPKHIPRFAFDRHESPLNLPLTLRVRSVPSSLSQFPFWLTATSRRGWFSPLSRPCFALLHPDNAVGILDARHRAGTRRATDDSAFFALRTPQVVMVNMGPDAEPAPFRIDDHDFERMLAQVKGDALQGPLFRGGSRWDTRSRGAQRLPGKLAACRMQHHTSESQPAGLTLICGRFTGGGRR